jgi:hypothetical protein
MDGECRTYGVDDMRRKFLIGNRGRRPRCRWMANIELELIWRVMKKIGFKWLRIGSNGGVL